MSRFRSLIILLICAFITIAFGQQEARLLRFPTVNGDKVVFSYAGDLYTVSTNGGVARRITSDVGYEMFARFSPDGRTLAFTGQYDGNTEIYVMTADGGIPKRLTYTATLGRDDVSDRMGPNNITMCWKDNTTIIYRSRQREFNDFKGQLFSVSVNGGLSEQLPLPRGGFCSYSPDKTKLAYNRVFREFRTWKRYRGGQADDIWIYDFKSKTTTNITSNPAQDIIPMWYNNTVYFVSDRTGRLNLYSYDLTSKQTKQLTDFKDFDVKFPSLGDKAIAFENGGYIYLFDIATGISKKIDIQINEDYDLSRPVLADVSRSINAFDISPEGKRALFDARGEIFTVPQKSGPTRNLTNTSGAHERSPVWSPDGRWIAYISDVSGEDEIYLQDQAGAEKPKQLTTGGDCYKFEIVWSPDSKKILWNDRKQKLQFIDIDTKKVTEIAESKDLEFNDFTWSPDSRWIAYVNDDENNVSRIYVYSLEEKKSQPVTDNWFSSSAPTFSEDCKYLYFISDRNFSPSYGWTEWNHIYRDMAKLYLIPLAKNIHSPFEPKSDEVTIKDTTKTEKKDETKLDKVTIDFDNIFNRVIEIPVGASAYRRLSSASGKLYYQRRGTTDEKTKLLMFDFDTKKETELGDVDGYVISFDKKKMIIGQSGVWSIIDLPYGKIDLKERLSLSDMTMMLDRRQEWTQIFNESWRQMRDFFYAPNMHGVDWEKVHDNYLPLVAYVNHRADLTYIIGEMIGELNIGHAYVGGGDYPRPERIKLGLLGAQLERDPIKKYYKIVKILKGANWDKSLRSPLTETGVDVKEGEYIIAVNGRPTNEMNDIFESLVNTAGKQVVLTVNTTPATEGSRTVTVIPIESELDLYYYNWVQNNIEKVNKASDGEIGYIHIPDMGVNGLNQFARLYYPQLTKKALIIDVRGNGGGNVSPMIMERLTRELNMFTVARNSSVHTDPSGMHVGPKAALIDEFSASDGDIFSYRFKFNHLGKTIGKRTWGGVVGIRGTLPFVDGGFLNRPEFSRFDIAGNIWIMEGVGVEPDIMVDNDPAEEFSGNDQQLNKAIEVLKEELKKAQTETPEPPPYPNKSK